MNQQTLRVTCRGRDAVVELVGAGRDVVFAGAAAPMAWTRPAAHALAELGYRVVNFDYGSGDPSPELRTSLDQVHDVEAVMEAARTDSAVIVGLSRGAITAYGMAGRRPGLTEGVALVVPVAGFGDTLQSDSPDVEADDGQGPPDVGQIAREVFSAGFLSERMDDAISVLATQPGSVARVERREEPPFPTALTVHCPILIIEAGADVIVRPEHPARYRREHPDATYVLVEQASHGWIMEDPRSFASIVDDFVRARLT